MKKYTQLGYGDIVKIEILLKMKMKQAEIAIRLRKNKSTISRCVKKYGDENGFDAEKVWREIKENRRKKNSHPRIMEKSLLEKYVLEKIKTYWTPEQIAGRWRQKTEQPLSHETIYQYIYKNQPQMVKLYFRRKGKKYQRKRAEKYQIMDRRMIDERPSEVENREILGHWEGDTIVGKNHRQGIVTNVERKSGLLLAQKVPKRTAQNVADVTKEMFDQIPDKLKISMTYDNGKEFAWHKIIEAENGMTVYFAHAYAPWERGSNENTNGLLRQFIPKGTNFDDVSVEDLQKYVDLINNRPRKRLNWRTPFEVFHDIPICCTSI
jgi:IS30 family transposase